jgi:hypothetical protein
MRNIEYRPLTITQLVRREGTRLHDALGFT